MATPWSGQDITLDPVHQSRCMRCTWGPRVTMLSGYVICDAQCECCGHVSDLALCRVEVR